MSSTTTSSLPDDGADAKLPASQIWRAGLIGTAIGVVGNVIFYWLVGLLNVPMQLPLGGPGSPLQPLPLEAVIITSTVPGIIATGLFWLFTRYIARPVPKFIGVSLVFLVLSFLPTWSLPTLVATKVVLSIMHIIAAAGIVGGLVQFTRNR